jgi:hypothetical protein
MLCTRPTSGGGAWRLCLLYVVVSLPAGKECCGGVSACLPVEGRLQAAAEGCVLGRPLQAVRVIGPLLCYRATGSDTLWQMAVLRCIARAMVVGGNR